MEYQAPWSSILSTKPLEVINSSTKLSCAGGHGPHHPLSLLSLSLSSSLSFSSPLCPLASVLVGSQFTNWSTNTLECGSRALGVYSSIQSPWSLLIGVPTPWSAEFLGYWNASGGLSRWGIDEKVLAAVHGAPLWGACYALGGGGGGMATTISPGFQLEIKSDVRRCASSILPTVGLHIMSAPMDVIEQALRQSTSDYWWCPGGTKLRTSVSPTSRQFESHVGSNCHRTYEDTGPGTRPGTQRPGWRGRAHGGSWQAGWPPNTFAGLWSTVVGVFRAPPQNPNNIFIFSLRRTSSERTLSSKKTWKKP